MEIPTYRDHFLHTHKYLILLQFLLYISPELSTFFRLISHLYFSFAKLSTSSHSFPLFLMICLFILFLFISKHFSTLKSDYDDTLRESPSKTLRHLSEMLQPGKH